VSPDDPPQPQPQSPGAQLLMAPLCVALIAICLALFFFVDDLLGLHAEGLSRPVGPGALYGPFVQSGEWWRVIGNVFEHGNFLHLALNMMAVWNIGRFLERVLGTWRFAVVSLACTLGASAAALIFNFDVITVGASGMILGWVGAMFPIATSHGRRELGFILVQAVMISLLPNVSWAGHAGGFLAGLVMGGALRFGRPVFDRASPVLIFLLAVLVVLAGTGQFSTLGLTS
jgi:rhomboid protease GluP